MSLPSRIFIRCLLSAISLSSKLIWGRRRWYFIPLLALLYLSPRTPPVDSVRLHSGTRRLLVLAGTYTSSYLPTYLPLRLLQIPIHAPEVRFNSKYEQLTYAELPIFLLSIWPCPRTTSSKISLHAKSCPTKCSFDFYHPT
jgi:hypothetical protein